MSAAPISVGADALTLTWVFVGSLILELLILIVFLVRVAWWLSQRFTLIDATLVANAKNKDGFGGDAERLFVSACYADQGPSQKRVRPAPMGLSLLPLAGHWRAVECCGPAPASYRW